LERDRNDNENVFVIATIFETLLAFAFRDSNIAVWQEEQLADVARTTQYTKLYKSVLLRFSTRQNNII